MTKYKQDKSMKAFTMYVAEIPMIEIAKAIGVNRNTISKWQEIHNWREEKENILSTIRKADKRTMNEKHMILINAIHTQVAKQLQEGKLKASAKDGLEAIKMERLMNDLSTENIKTEIVGEVSDVKKEIKKILEEDNE